MLTHAAFHCVENTPEVVDCTYNGVHVIPAKTTISSHTIVSTVNVGLRSSVWVAYLKLFLKTLKILSQVRSILKTSSYWRLFDIIYYSIPNHDTRALLVVSTKSCYRVAQNNGRPAVKVRPKMRK